MTPIEELIILEETFGSHVNISHWAVSSKAMGKGDFFSRIKSGSDCSTSTYVKVKWWFDNNWPTDLTWPENVTRPSLSKEAS